MTQRMTAAELIAMAQKPKEARVKGARRARLDGLSFDSELERDWWARLCLTQRAGQIRDLKRQVNIPLIGRDGPILTPKGRPMQYRADFTYLDRTGALIVADAKGFRTEVYTLKRAILAAQGITITELR